MNNLDTIEYNRTNKKIHLTEPERILTKPGKRNIMCGALLANYNTTFPTKYITSERNDEYRFFHIKEIEG